MSKLAQLIAQEEGFNVAGSLPNRNHNPGDLKHSPHASHEGEGPNDIGIEPSVADGWADLERQLGLFAKRRMTLRQAVYVFAPPNENDTARYLEFVCTGLLCEPDILVADALKIE